MENMKSERDQAIEIGDTFSRVKILLGMVSNEIDLHNSTDFDNIDALAHAIRNEISLLEMMISPEVDQFEGEQIEESA